MTKIKVIVKSGLSDSLSLKNMIRKDWRIPCNWRMPRRILITQWRRISTSLESTGTSSATEKKGERRRRDWGSVQKILYFRDNVYSLEFDHYWAEILYIFIFRWIFVYWTHLSPSDIFINKSVQWSKVVFFKKISLFS